MFTQQSSTRRLRRFFTQTTPARAAVASGLLVGLLCAGVVGGISYASIPDASGVIHGCYQSRGTSHALKIIDTAVVASCPTGYLPLNWSQTGPQGATGPAGPTGATGATGATGPAGPGHTYTVNSFQNLIAGETQTLTPLCNAGDVVIGGYSQTYGTTNFSGDQRYAVVASIGPTPAAQGWTATATGLTLAPDFLDVTAVCLSST